MNSGLRFLLALTALLILVLALGFLGEWLGDWTDAHPEQRVVAWIGWNAALLVVLGAVVWSWRGYRRSRQLPPPPPG